MISLATSSVAGILLNWRSNSDPLLCALLRAVRTLRSILHPPFIFGGCSGTSA
jgi:hypothetical protein